MIKKETDRPRWNAAVLSSFFHGRTRSGSQCAQCKHEQDYKHPKRQQSEGPNHRKGEFQPQERRVKKSTTMLNASSRISCTMRCSIVGTYLAPQWLQERARWNRFVRKKLNESGIFRLAEHCGSCLIP